MKTNFKNVFNEWEDDLIDISENTLIEDTIVSGDSVKSRVFSELGINKKKKPFSKTFKLTLIAATLALAILVGTTVINANGGIERIREFFTGSVSSSDLYDGGNVEVTTLDKNLNVELLAVTGDKNNFYAVIQAEKKDGTTFTDEDYVYSPNNQSSYIGVLCRDQSGEYYGGVNHNTTKKYRLSNDGKKLNIFISMDLSTNVFKHYPDIGNGIITVKSELLGFRKIKEKIAVYDSINVDIHNEVVEIAKQKNIKDWTWIETPEGVIFCTVDTKEYEIPFEITFSMKHNTNNTIYQTLSLSNAPDFIKNTAENVKMEISPFNIRISCDGNRLFHGCPPIEDMIWYSSDLCFERIDPENSKIILDDGNEYYFEVIPWSEEEFKEDGKFSVHVDLKLNYSLIPNPTYTIENVVVDTSKISQIIINGNTVYKK